LIGAKKKLLIPPPEKLGGNPQAKDLFTLLIMTSIKLVNALKVEK